MNKSWPKWGMTPKDRPMRLFDRESFLRIFLESRTGKLYIALRLEVLGEYRYCWRTKRRQAEASTTRGSAVQNEVETELTELIRAK